jgi:hypothetical protein
MPVLDSTFLLLRLSLLRGNSAPTYVSPRLTTTHRFDQQRQNSELPSGPSATDKTLIGSGLRFLSLHNPPHLAARERPLMMSNSPPRRPLGIGPYARDVHRGGPLVNAD